MTTDVSMERIAQLLDCPGLQLSPGHSHLYRWAGPPDAKGIVSGGFMTDGDLLLAILRGEVWETV